MNEMVQFFKTLVSTEMLKVMFAVFGLVAVLKKLLPEKISGVTRDRILPALSLGLSVAVGYSVKLDPLSSLIAGAFLTGAYAEFESKILKRIFPSQPAAAGDKK